MLADDVAWALPQFKAEAEARMRDTCDIVYATGRTAQNESSGLEVPVYATRFSSTFRLPPSSAGDTFDAAGVVMARAPRRIDIPVDKPEVFKGDIVVVTAVDSASDPTLLGKRFTVVTPAVGSQLTARRMQVEEEM